jgi:cobalamin biosynthesis protein CobD/CbiB
MTPRLPSFRINGILTLTACALLFAGAMTLFLTDNTMIAVVCDVIGSVLLLIFALRVRRQQKYVDEQLRQIKRETDSL